MSAEGRPVHRVPLPGGAASLEGAVGKPRDQWTAEDLVELVQSADLGLVSLLHVGGDGWMKSLDFAPRGESHLRGILEGGERADGSSLFPGSGIRVGASDILLRPRPARAFLDPFSSIPTLAILCGHAEPSGRALGVSPDTVVRRARERLLAETGTELQALGEVEYFLGKAREAGDIYGEDDRGYHAASPFVFGEGLRREAIVLLSELGVPVKYGHSEVGYIEAKADGELIWEQHEIELDLLSLPDAADAIVLTQWVLRNLAQRRGLRCSMAPMMREGHAGNGLHVHLAPLREGRRAAIRRDDGTLSEEARWLIGGLVSGGAALMAFGNRVSESFDRLRQGKEAPQRIAWGEGDRSALVRLPVVPERAGAGSSPPPTVEFRLPDGSAHPHLLLAGIAQAYVAVQSRGDLEKFLSGTHLAGEGIPAGAVAVPHDGEGVAAALAEAAGWLQAGEVFPEGLIAQQAARLRAAQR